MRAEHDLSGDDPSVAWRRSLDAVLATDWTPEDLESWLQNLASDSEVSEAEYQAASAEVHSIVYDDPGSVLDDPGLWEDEDHDLEHVYAAVTYLIEGDEPITEESLASVGVSYEQYWALVAEQETLQDQLWQRGSDAASWSASPPVRDAAYDRALDAPTIGEQASDPGRTWSDPVDPARGLLVGEQAVTEGRDRIFHALTGLDPAGHDTRELTDLVRTDWLEDWTPEEMRTHYRRTDYPVNRLGTEHQPAADLVHTQELVDWAVRAAEQHATAPGTGRSDDDEEATRAEQLNHWSAEDGNSAGAGSTDEAVSDDRG